MRNNKRFQSGGRNQKNPSIEDIDDEADYSVEERDNDYDDKDYQRMGKIGQSMRNKNQRNDRGIDSSRRININSSMASNFNQNYSKTHLRPDTGQGKFGNIRNDKSNKTLGKNKKGKKNNINLSQIEDDKDDIKQLKDQGKVKREIIGKKSIKTNLYRDLCLQFQLIGANFRKVTSNIDSRDNDIFDIYKLVDQIYTNLGTQDSLIEDLINRTFDDFYANNARRLIKLSKWLERLHIEMEKFFTMQRIFLLIQRRMNRKDSTFFQLLIEKYNLKINEDGKVSANDFCKVLEWLGVIRNSNIDDKRIIIDEYGIIDEEILKDLQLNPDVMKVIQTDQNEAKDKEKDNQKSQAQDVVLTDENQQQILLDFEKKKIENTYFIFDEIEQDFQYFQKQIFPSIEIKVLQLIVEFCLQTQQSLRELFFINRDQNNDENDEDEDEDLGKMQINENSEKKQQEKKKEAMKYKSFIDYLDLYYIADQIKLYFLETESNEYDFGKIFQVFALKAANSLNEKKVQFAYIYLVYLKKEIQDLIEQYKVDFFFDQDLERQTANDIKLQLNRFLANELYDKKRQIDFNQIFNKFSKYTADNLFDTLNENFKIKKFPIIDKDCLNFIGYYNYQNQNNKENFSRD